MILEEHLQLFDLRVILDIQITPLIPIRQLQRLLWDVRLIELLDLALLLYFVEGRHNGLRVPELVLTKDLDEMLELVTGLEVLVLVVFDVLEARQHFLFREIWRCVIQTDLFACFLDGVNRIDFGLLFISHFTLLLLLWLFLFCFVAAGVGIILLFFFAVCLSILPIELIIVATITTLIILLLLLFLSLLLCL